MADADHLVRRADVRANPAVGSREISDPRGIFHFPETGMLYGEAVLGPTDLYVCLYLSKPTTDTPRFEGVAEDLGIGLATAHRSVKRLIASGLLLPSRTVHHRALLDVLLHAARHVYYVETGGLTRGVPTADAAPPLSNMMTPSDPPPVWPDPLGNTRGYSIEPLHESASQAAIRDPELHALLALVDALRIGQARVRSLAAAELRILLVP